jgi:hypothetical protein
MGNTTMRSGLEQVSLCVCVYVYIFMYIRISVCQHSSLDVGYTSMRSGLEQMSYCKLLPRLKSNRTTLLHTHKHTHTHTHVRSYTHIYTGILQVAAEVEEKNSTADIAGHRYIHT